MLARFIAQKWPPESRRFAEVIWSGFFLVCGNTINHAPQNGPRWCQRFRNPRVPRFSRHPHIYIYIYIHIVILLIYRYPEAQGFEKSRSRLFSKQDRQYLEIQPSRKPTPEQVVKLNGHNLDGMTNSARHNFLEGPGFM